MSHIDLTMMINRNQKQEPMDHEAMNVSGSDSRSKIMPNYNQFVMRHKNDHTPLTYPGLEPMESSGTCSRDETLNATRHPTSMTGISTDVEMGDLKQLENICSSTRISSPLTPPDSEPIASPRTSSICDEEMEDPAKRLDSICSWSSKSSECSIEGTSEEQGLQIPKITSNGKVKKFKCRRCEFLAYTKVDFWKHSKEHIKPDKQLICPKCPFVTQHKHHLRAHLLIHEGKKPHKCPKCPYACVSKSMLNSHLKSHSNIYQYHCGECSFASKYCHSFKLHLRKNDHKPGVVLDEGGSPNPQQIIDVYGTSRGTMVKKRNLQPAEDTPSSTQMLLSTSSQLQVSEQREALSVPSVSSETTQVSPVDYSLAEPCSDYSAVPNVLAERPSSDVLSILGVLIEPSEFEVNDIESMDLSKQRRENNDNSSEDKGEYVMHSTVEAILGNRSDGEVAKGTILKCHFCDLSFGHSIMFSLHMGLHGSNNPFMCNMCGQECEDEIYLYMHLVRIAHPRVSLT